MIMRIIKYVIIFFVLITGYYGIAEAGGKSPGEPYIFIMRVNVVQMKTGDVLENYFVVVKNGRIESMAKDDLKGSFEGEIEIVEASGKYLLGGEFNTGKEEEFKPANIREGMTADFLILDSDPLDGEDEYDIYAIIKKGKLLKMK